MSSKVVDCCATSKTWTIPKTVVVHRRHHHHHHPLVVVVAVVVEWFPARLEWPGASHCDVGRRLGRKMWTLPLAQGCGVSMFVVVGQWT
eukprot:scaffold7405_cov204-Amphora_coffeaeformis.AAC.20